MPFHAHCSHIPLRISAARQTRQTDRTVEMQVVKTIGSECRVFPPQMLAQQYPGKAMVERATGYSSPGRGLQTTVVRISEIEINLEGTRQRTGHTQPHPLSIRPGKKTRS